MPHKETTLADVIEDQYYADLGARTGTAYNNMLVGERADRMSADLLVRRHRPQARDGVPLSSSVDHLFNHVPPAWIKRVGLLLAFVAAFGFGLQEGHDYTTAAIWGGAGVVTAALCWKLLILTVKLAIFAACCALVIGAVVLAAQTFLK